MHMCYFSIIPFDLWDLYRDSFIRPWRAADIAVPTVLMTKELIYDG